ncbi:DUF3311 domain-containing protein [Winogradskya consettensis]|uniref:DUF3311 domain-containing protein n=1 Tax=Winogradskya consettensis TaxID=113560 RepID=UPI001BB3A86E|nr:DUF3311 domain-containing protein [Actinoplanes consettensis]
MPSVKKDRRAWNWLLVVPVVVPLVTLFFNADEPRLAGFPLFYWLQLAFVALVVIVTTVVYQLTVRAEAKSDVA